MNTTPKQELQGIFFTHCGDKGWLYTVRWSVSDTADAKARCKELARRWKRPASVTIEDWNWPKSEAHCFHFECDAQGNDTTKAGA